MAAGGRGGLTRRARRSCGGWWPSATIALWTNIASCWRPAPGGGGSADRPCAALCGGSSCGAKKTLRASERDRSDIQAERALFCEQVRQLDPKQLVFIDQTGITTAMTRRCARAPRGERAHGSAPGGWRRLTVLGALCGEGMVAAMSIKAATTTPILMAFLQAVPIPERRPPSGRHRADGQSVRAQAQAGRDRPDQSRVQAPLPAALFTRSFAPRTRLV